MRCKWLPITTICLSFAIGLSAMAVERLGDITEFQLSWPSTERNGTHELISDPASGVIWTTGIKQDYIARVKPDGKIDYFPMPKGSNPHGMAFDKQGRLWVSLEASGFVVRLDDKGAIAEQIDVNIRSSSGQTVNPVPHAIAFGGDGKTIWFVGKATSTVGRIDENTVVKHFPLKTKNALPIYIALGPDGSMWGTQLIGNNIFRIRATGEVSEFPIPTANSRPIAIVPGPDGTSMWFSQEAGRKVARITSSGEINEYPIPLLGEKSLLAVIAFDREGNLWTQMYAPPPNKIGQTDHLVKIDKRIAAAVAGDLSGISVTYYRTPSRNTIMHRIIQAADGNMWFTELNGDRIGKILINDGRKITK